MAFDDLDQDEYIKKWLKRIKKPSTRRSYLQGMRYYTNFHKMTPTELFLEADNEEDMGVRVSRRKINERFFDFVEYLEEETELSDNSINGRLIGIRSFYSKLGVEVPKIERTRSGICKKENMAIPTVEDIRDVLRIADPLEKAIILVGCASGLAANEIRNLRVKDFREGYDSETGITTLEVRRLKVGFDFITFLTPEASQAVNDYLDFRGREAKNATAYRLSQLEKQRVVSDDGYLFILRNVPEKYLETRDEELRKISDDSLFKMYCMLSEKAQKNTPTGAYNIIRSHCMRKYFNSTLLGQGADSFHVEYWMGHMVDDTKASYYRANKKNEENIYSKYIPYLTIQKELAVADTQAYKDVVADRDKYKAEAYANAIDRVESEYWMSTHQKLMQDQEDRLKEQEEKIKKLEWLIEFENNPQKIAEDHLKQMKNNPEYKKRFEKL